MSRDFRHKNPEGASYHLINRVAGDPSFMPFQEAASQRKLTSLLERYLSLYFCDLASFTLMDNHYHLVIVFEKFRLLQRCDLISRAKIRFGKRWQLQTRHWDHCKWLEFNFKLFDVSYFMQHINGEFSKWYNRSHNRRGHFWAERFKSVEILDFVSLQETILYIELNPVRAGLVTRPEQWKRGSLHWRMKGKKKNLLIPLHQLFPPDSGMDSMTTYRARLYLRGAVATKDHHAIIPEAIVRLEEKRGFELPGLYSTRQRFFTDGVAIGSADKVSTVLNRYRESGRYKRRRNPIPQLGGRLFSLREQRSHAYPYPPPKQPSGR